VVLVVEAAMASLVNVRSTLMAAGRRSGGSASQSDALNVREVDALVARLLEEIKIPFASLGKRVLTQLSDLKQVLSADYCEAPGLPEKRLTNELAHAVETEIKARADVWKEWDDPGKFGDLVKKFGSREIEVRAEPYREGSGLGLRGFFARAEVGRKSKFVIFLNTAHHPAAVAATLGHELGHYLYGSFVGETAPMTAFMEGTFTAHLHEEHELFADSLVALSAYTPELIKTIGRIDRLEPGKSEKFFNRIQRTYEAIGPRFKLDLSQKGITAPWRVCYLTSMIHFFKLRCALLETAGV
jgi:hypothetical protein